jgi:Holliday junction resolvase RusA-like endonuclease
MLEFFVGGIPRPQGSKRGFLRNGRIILVEASKQLPEWRSEIVLAAREAIHDQNWVVADGPCRVEAVFFIPKGKTVKRKFPTTTPDADKLARGLLDAMTTAKVWLDDAQCVDLIVLKRYSDAPGVSVNVTVL